MNYEFSLLRKFPFGKQPGFVYILESPSIAAVKVGYSKKPLERARDLQAGNPDLKLMLFFPGSRTVETMIHKKFKRSRLGREWFKFSNKHFGDFVTEVTGCALFSNLLNGGLWVHDDLRPAMDKLTEEIKSHFDELRQNIKFQPC